MIGILFGVMAGFVSGVGGYTFVYAKGASYLTNDPRACANCHVMQEQFDGWTRSSHHAAATCNDCHTPHSLVPKLYVKARNGFWHSFYFTLGGFPEPIRITPSNKSVTEESCRYCHQDVVHAIDAWHQPAREMSCIRCHDSVGHL